MIEYLQIMSVMIMLIITQMAIADRKEICREEAISRSSDDHQPVFHHGVESPGSRAGS